MRITPAYTHSCSYLCFMSMLSRDISPWPRFVTRSSPVHSDGGCCAGVLRPVPAQQHHKGHRRPDRRHQPLPCRPGAPLGWPAPPLLSGEPHPLCPSGFLWRRGGQRAAPGHQPGGCACPRPVPTDAAVRAAGDEGGGRDQQGARVLAWAAAAAAPAAAAEGVPWCGLQGSHALAPLPKASKRAALVRPPPSHAHTWA